MPHSATKTNEELPNFSVLIVAAGKGIRAQTEVPKQYIDIEGKTVLRHAIDCFATHPCCKKIHVVINPNHLAYYEKSVAGINTDMPLPTMGSDSRQGSVFKGLKALSDCDENEIILIHDAARIFVKHTEINELLKSFSGYDAATLATPVSDSLRRVRAEISTNDILAEDIISRDNIWAVQTPQAFKYTTILKAHEIHGHNNEWTDDTSLASALNIPVRMVMSSRLNFKITTQEDIELARSIIKGQ
jgi:2-C-methyl-D-erythritol 4-phosphate cytidylyltransferase